jgi:ubiquinone/menaquinone biosynthesis C-methylase UbiE
MNVSDVVAGVYSRFAGVYDAVVTRGLLVAGVPGGRAALAEWTEVLDDTDGVVLDVPVGTGEYLGFLRSPAVGVDLAPGMLARARHRHPRAPLVRADVFRLPFGDGSVGAVFTALGLHLFPSPRDAVVEMTRVLRPGGRLAGAVPVWVAAPTFSRGPSALRAALDVPGLTLTRFEQRRLVVFFAAVRD